MTNDVKKVPELRFPEFSGEWEEKMLGDVLTILDGDRGKNYPSGSDFLEYGHTLFLNASNVTKNGFSFTLKQYITEKKSISMGNGKLVKNDVVLTTRGSIGNIGWYDEEIYRKTPYARINSGMLILRSNNKDMASFVSQFLMSTKGKRQIDRISFGSAQPQLTKKDIKLYRIDFPQIKEQQKIGDFFSKLDRQIELEEQKLSLLEEQKKGYMQKIFSQELRFKGNNGEEYPKWESKKLEEVAIINTGKSKIVNEESAAYSNLGSTGVLGKSSHYEYDGNFILTARVGHYAGKLYNFSGKANISDNTIFLETDLNLNFTLNMLNNYNLKRIAFGSGQPLIKSSELKKLIFNIPCGEEEQKIGGFLSGFDSLIGKQSHKIELLKERKKGFLQKMFV
ncbi:restriction endonuclease subunit S [Staphylococcus xylosus]|uniref:restriction endonuclease subunit S n=1 Tax=Staphylococcus xylosus TaxID=1288 RepID=UPI0008536FE5|nr:restriction endonuclease subunit S [Staphylococcus xylosus]OEK85819.1 hypothetical protein AST17_06640 [Staphylococcus xylosus]